MPSLCFSDRSEKPDGRPGLWLTETFSTSPLKPLNSNQRNSTGSKISGLCFFRADRKNKMTALASDWLRHFWLPLWNSWTEARYQLPLQSLWFLRGSEKQDGRTGLWLTEIFSTSLNPLNGIQRNLKWHKIDLDVLYRVCVCDFFLGGDRKNKMVAWPLMCWDIYDFSSETVERNSTKLDRKQDLNVLYQVCVFGADRNNKIAALAPDWLRPLKLLNGNQRNLTGSKISDSSTKFVFFGPIVKTRWPPWPLIVWDIFDFSETAERKSIKLDRKQDLRVLYQVCVFSGRSEK